MTTVKETIHQHEKLANKLQFIIPAKYEEQDLSACKAILKYHNDMDQATVELLTKEDEAYKNDYMQFFLSVDSGFTNLPGNITMYITFIEVDEDNNVTYVLNTKECTVEIEPVKDYFEYVNSFDGSVAKVDSIIGSKLATD